MNAEYKNRTLINADYVDFNLWLSEKSASQYLPAKIRVRFKL